MTQLVLNHITRMTHPRLCIAGVDWATETHLRPMPGKGDPITRDLLAEEGGPLQLGACLDLGRTRPTPDPPEVEDHRCETANFRTTMVLEGEEYLELLESVAAADLTAAFGEELERDGRTYAIDPGKGAASLACVRATGGERLLFDFGQPRLRTEEGAVLPITDVRLYEPDHETTRTNLLGGISERLGAGVPAYLMLGLSRPFPKGDDPPRHWLQVNGICLADAPLGGEP